MRRRLLVAASVGLTLLGLAGAGLSADGPTREVTMPGKAYAPDRLDVLVGTTVTWRNDDTIDHTVTADGDEFDSGYLTPGGTFSYTFARQGTFRFHCTIHRFMQGVVRVFGLVLNGPEDPVAVGARVVLTGLAPAGTASVTLRGGSRERTVTPRPDGSFAFVVRADAPAVYRAVAGRLASSAVRLGVRPSVAANLVAGSVRTSTTPARPRAVAALQRYDRDHFRWLPLRRTRLDGAGRTSITVPPGRWRLRVVVRGSAGWADGISPTLLTG